MKCRQCGQPIEPGAAFCGHCGGKQNPADTPVTHIPAQKKNASKKLMVFLSLFLVVAVATTVGVLLLLSDAGTGGSDRIAAPTLSLLEAGSGTLSPLDDERVQVVVNKVNGLSLAQDVDATANMVEVKRSDGKTRFDFHATLKIPYDADTIDADQDARDCVVAAHYNYETGQWDPVLFDLDTRKKVVLVYTDHFSVFSVFTFHNKGKRWASVSVPPSMLNSDLPRVDYNKIFADMAVGNESSAMAAGAAIVSDPVNIGGNALTLATEPLKMLDPLSDWPRVDKIGDAFLGIGIALAGVQLVLDYQEEGKVGAKTLGNAIKNATYLSISKFGTSALKLKSVGFFMIDYSLNAFGTEAWDQLEAKHRRLYKNYYNRKYGGELGEQKHLIRSVYGAYKKSLTDGYKFDLGKEVNSTFTTHCAEFWSRGVIEHVDDMEQASDTWFSNLPESKQEKISQGYCGSLMATAGKAILETMVHRIGMDLKEEYLANLDRIEQELNTTVKVVIKEPREDERAPLKYKDHLLRFAPLGEYAAVRSWSGTVPESGEARTAFRVAGYLSAGAPTKIQVFSPGDNPDKDRPVLEVPFKLSGEEITVLLGNSTIVGTYKQDTISIHGVMNDAMRRQGRISMGCSDMNMTLTVQEDRTIRVAYSFQCKYLPNANSHTPNIEQISEAFTVTINEDNTFYHTHKGDHFKGRFITDDICPYMDAWMSTSGWAKGSRDDMRVWAKHSSCPD